MVTLVAPQKVVRLHDRAYRMEGAIATPSNRQHVATLCDLAEIDHAYLESTVRFTDFKLLALDMDSTLITIECIDEMADFVGKKNEVTAITEAAMRGEITDFAESLRLRVSLLAGAHVDVMRRVFDERLRLSPGAEQLVAAAKRAGLCIAILSGGFDYFAQRLKTSMQLQFAYANDLEILDGRLTGRLVGTIIDAYKKADLLSATAKNAGVSSREIIVIGDGANDIQMMKLGSISVAFHAKPVVREEATHSIKFGPLSTVVDWLPVA